MIEFWFLEITWNEDIIRHKKQYIHFRNHIPECISKYKWKMGVRLSLSRSQKNMSYGGYFNANYWWFFLLQDWYTRFYNLNYLTERPFDLEIISKISNQENTQKNLAYGWLMQSLTYLDIDLEEAIKIRNQEQESFTLYRLNIEKFKRETKRTGFSEI